MAHGSPRVAVGHAMAHSLLIPVGYSHWANARARSNRDAHSSIRRTDHFTRAVESYAGWIVPLVAGTALAEMAVFVVLSLGGSEAFSRSLQRPGAYRAHHGDGPLVSGFSARGGGTLADAFRLPVGAAHHDCAECAAAVSSLPASIRADADRGWPALRS